MWRMKAKNSAVIVERCENGFVVRSLHDEGTFKIRPFFVFNRLGYGDQSENSLLGWLAEHFDEDPQKQDGP
jgi:hypothetical protein